MLPFFNLNDYDFNSIINQRFNLQNNLLTEIQHARHLNIANESREDNNFDPFNNGLLRQINDKCHYYTQENFRDLNHGINDHKPFSMLHFIIRSIRNKHDELFIFPNSLNLSFSVIGLSEAWFTDKCPQVYDIPTHNFITKNRKTKTGGGVAIYITKDMIFKTTDDLTMFHDEIFESISIELQLDDKDKILIGVIYRPPNNKINEFTDELENFFYNENQQ